MIQVGDAIWQCPQWRGLVQGAVRPVGVVEGLVFPQYRHQVAQVPDQGPAEAGDERTQTCEADLDLVIGQVLRHAGGQLLQFAPEPGDVVKIQAPQGDPQPVFGRSEWQLGEDSVDRQQPVLDVLDGSIEGTVEGDEVLSAPFRQTPTPFLPALASCVAFDGTTSTSTWGSFTSGARPGATARSRPPSRAAPSCCPSAPSLPWLPIRNAKPPNGSASGHEKIPLSRTARPGSCIRP
jgi:hypothetical protein